jgi:hypothetical protein
MGHQYGKISIRNVDPGPFTITMDDKTIGSPSTKKDIARMDKILIKTSNQDEISARNQLR